MMGISKKNWFALLIIPTLLCFVVPSSAEAQAARRVDAAALELEMANRIESMLDMLIGEDRAVVKVELALTEVSSPTATPQKAAIETMRPLGLPGMLTARPIPSEEGPEAVPPPPETGTLIPLITSIAVNILVDESVAEDKVDLIKELVPQWVGLDYNRGDTLALTPVPWRDVTKEKKETEQLKLTQMGLFSNLATVGAIAAIFITVLIFSLIFRKKAATIAQGVGAVAAGGGGAGGGAAAPGGEPAVAEQSSNAIKSEVGRVADVVGGLSKELGRFQESIVGGGGKGAGSEKLEKLLEEIREVLAKGAPGGAAKGGGGGSPEVVEALRGIQDLLKSGAAGGGGAGGGGRGAEAGPVLDSPFKFINSLSAQDIKRIIEGEPDELCIPIITHLQPKKSSELFSSLEPEKRDELVAKMVEVDEGGKEPDREMVLKIKEFLEKKLKAIRLFTDFTPVVGSEALAESLSLASSEMVHATLDKLRKRNPKLADETRKKLFLFEDIPQLDEKTISLILVELDRELLKVALKGCADDVREKIFGAMSERAAAMLKEDLEIMTDLPKERYEEAMKSIIATIKGMEKKGVIKLPTSKT